MEDPRFLRIILFGLILAGLTIGYLIFTGRFIRPQTPVPAVSPTPFVISAPLPLPSASPSPIASINPSPSGRETASSAYTRIVDRTQNQVTTLPKTGLPTILIGIASLSAVISGWFLRRYPE